MLGRVDKRDSQTLRVLIQGCFLRSSYEGTVKGMAASRPTISTQIGISLTDKPTKRTTQLLWLSGNLSWDDRSVGLGGALPSGDWLASD